MEEILNKEFYNAVKDAFSELVKRDELKLYIVEVDARVIERISDSEYERDENGKLLVKTKHGAWIYQKAEWEWREGRDVLDQRHWIVEQEERKYNLWLEFHHPDRGLKISPFRQFCGLERLASNFDLQKVKTYTAQKGEFDLRVPWTPKNGRIMVPRDMVDARLIASYEWDVRWASEGDDKWEGIPGEIVHKMGSLLIEGANDRLIGRFYQLIKSCQ